MLIRPKNRIIKPQSAETLTQLKIRTLRTLLIVSGCTIALIWLFESLSNLLDIIDTIFYPLMMVSATISLLILARWPKYISALELFNFSILAIYILIYAYENLYSTGRTLDIYSAATIGQWSPLIYMIAFIFFDMRRAIIASLAVYVLLFLPIIFLMIGGDLDLWFSPNFYLLMNMAIAHLFFVIVLTTITRLKENFIRIESRAEFLAQVANIDYLTGIPNRRHMSHQFELAIQQKATGIKFAAILIDIDHFKLVNDRYGHDIGDQVLIALAAIVKPILRSSDTIGRWGGEEFLLLAYYQQENEITGLAERLRVAIGSYPYPTAGSISASFGVAFHQPEDTIDTLIRRADQALYRAKDLGRNRLEVA